MVLSLCLIGVKRKRTKNRDKNNNNNNNKIKKEEENVIFYQLVRVKKTGKKKGWMIPYNFFDFYLFIYFFGFLINYNYI